MNKYRTLQAGRGLAALIVACYHATKLSERLFGWTYAGGFFNFGFSGVDFFFVLSGFIIYYVHHNDIGLKQRLKTYLFKRFARVVPIYWFWTLIFVPFFYLFPNLGEGFERTLGGLLSSLFFLHEHHSPIIRAGWSLNFEVYFYLMFAVGIFVGPRLAKIGLISWAAIIVISNFFLEVPYDDIFFSSFHLEFILGLTAGYVVTQGFEKYATIFLYSGALLFILGAYFSTKLFIFGQFDLPLFFGIPSAMIIYGACVLERKGRLRTPEFLVSLGNASYSIYLTHGNFLSGWARLIPMKSNFTLTLNLAASVGMGYLAYKFIEVPVSILLKPGKVNT